jgi:tetraacyldisaccharide 4'-kinase
MNALSPLGWIYGLVQNTRNFLYDRGIFKSYPLGSRTISIGNLTTGGTGKTPLVAYIARLLADNGEKVCVLTRGYGRRNASRRVLVSDSHEVLVDAGIGGDEPVELAQKLIGKAVVIADRDRVSAAKWARREFEATVFLLDDGFQHRCAARDLDIVCVDATNPFGNDEILPAGILREGPQNLRRAGIVVITRANLVIEISDLKSQISEFAPGSKILTATNKIIGIARNCGTGGQYKNGTPKQKIPSKESRAFAFCGLGNPLSFFRQLEVDGFNIGGRKMFPDHYYYSQGDVSSVEKEATAAGAEILITTAKDAVRLSHLEFSMGCYVAEVEMQIDNEAGFREIIYSS